MIIWAERSLRGALRAVWLPFRSFVGTSTSCALVPVLDPPPNPQNLAQENMPFGGKPASQHRGEHVFLFFLRTRIAPVALRSTPT